MKRLLLVTIVLILACAAFEGQNCTLPGSSSPNGASPVQPPRTLRRYSASLTIDLKDKSRVEQQAWTVTPQKKGLSNKVLLMPPQGYVRCMLAGEGDVLRFGCASGFRPVNPAQTPPNANGFVEDTPNTTGTTLQTGAVNTITYDCVRAVIGPHHKPNAKK